MTYASALAALESRLSAAWSETPIHDAADLIERPDPPAAFVVMDAEDADARIAAVGDGVTLRHSGALVLTIFAPVEDGRAAVRAMQDRLAAVFPPGSVWGGARVWTPTHGKVLTADGDVGWLSAELEIRFTTDVHHAAA